MENYKDIPGYEGIYQISDLGNVKSLTRQEISGGNIRTRKGKMMKPRIDQDGYLRIFLHKNSISKTFGIHRLILKTFSHQPEQESVNHKDGDKLNNNINNLEWCSKKENDIHAMKMGLKPMGEKHYKAKLSIKDITKIKFMLQQNISHTKIARYFKVNISTIQDIYKGRSWKSYGLVFPTILSCKY